MKLLRKMFIVFVVCFFIVTIGYVYEVKAVQENSLASQKKSAKTALKKKLRKLYNSFENNKKEKWNESREWEYSGYYGITWEEYDILFNFYYVYNDIDGDGIDELYVLEESQHYGNEVRGNLMIFSYKNGKVKNLTKDKYSSSITVSGPRGFSNELIFSGNGKYIYVEFSVDDFENSVYKFSGKKYNKLAYSFYGEDTWYELYNKSTKKLEYTSKSKYESYVNKVMKNKDNISWKIYKK